jgi:hypothetical protein
MSAIIDVSRMAKGLHVFGWAIPENKGRALGDAPSEPDFRVV